MFFDSLKKIQQYFKGKSKLILLINQSRSIFSNIIIKIIKI